MSNTTRLELLEQFRDTPKHLHEAIAGLTVAQLDLPYRNGGWTARQVVHHIADSHAHAYLRVKRILTEDHPTLQPYDQDVWSKLPDANGDVAPSLAIVDGLHARWSALMATLSEDQWNRAAYHPERGEITVHDMLVLYSNHGMNHVAQIKSIR